MILSIYLCTEKCSVSFFPLLYSFLLPSSHSEEIIFSKLLLSFVLFSTNSPRDKTSKLQTALQLDHSSLKWKIYDSTLKTRVLHEKCKSWMLFWEFKSLGVFFLLRKNYDTLWLITWILHLDGNWRSHVGLFFILCEVVAFKFLFLFQTFREI